MSTITLKTNLHLLIDEIEDINLLEHFYEVLHLHKIKPAKNEVTDELNKNQIIRLEKALEQSQKGQVISHEQMKNKVNQWLTR
jgi:spore coat polysaccharide biosynthesis protein SpsF (cytidylyltransferase family)